LARIFFTTSPLKGYIWEREGSSNKFAVKEFKQSYRKSRSQINANQAILVVYPKRMVLLAFFIHTNFTKNGSTMKPSRNRLDLFMKKKNLIHDFNAFITSYIIKKKINKN
jgi:hypothetical protein